MCFKSGAVACAPPIVRDESSRVFLGDALQQSPPLRRPSSMVGQSSLEVNRKDEPAVRRGRCRRRQNRQKCGRFIPALTGELGQWGTPLFPSLSKAPDMGTSAQIDIAGAEGSHLGEP